MKGPAASVGLFAKTGRAIAVVLSGPPASPRLLERRELTLSSENLPTTVQPYHAVMELPWPEALSRARSSVRAIEGLAADSLRRFLRDLASGGVRVTAVGIVGSAGRDPARIGNPHIRAHAAEGQLFRRVLEAAASECGLSHLSFTPGELLQEAAERIGLAAEDLGARAHALGRGLVRPWRIEERSATVAAWAALAR